MPNGRPKVLNLYAGIGGNRKLWENADVTAVEINAKIAAFYQEEFPDDDVIVADAHTFLEQHYNDGWDFIWTSPPCQSHTKLNPMMWASDAKQNASREPRYPDMKLYQEITLLQYFAECDWVVENVESYYPPLIEPQKVGGHFLWSNVSIPPFEHSKRNILEEGSYAYFEEKYGYDVSDAGFGHRKDQVLKNCVDPQFGKHVFDAVFNDRQATVADF